VFITLNHVASPVIIPSGTLGNKPLNKVELILTLAREIIEENGRSVEMHAVVTDYRENQLLAMHLDGKFNVVDVEWRLEEIGERTRLTLNSNIRFKSFIKILSVLMRPIFKKKIVAQLQGELARLKEICERDIGSYA